MKTQNTFKQPSRSIRAFVLSVAMIGSLPLGHAGLLDGLAPALMSEAKKAIAERNAAKTAGAPGVGFRNCANFFPNSMVPRLPKGAEATWKTWELCYDAFAILHSGSTRTPLYVVERLNQDRLRAAKGQERTDRFFADARLPRDERAELSDYASSGFQRGHLSGAATQPSPQAMAQSFSLANMVPMPAKVNKVLWWNGAERSTLRYVERAKGDVYVFTGAAFVGPVQTLQGRTKNRVSIPSHVFKLVYDPSTNRAWAHWIENNNEARIGAPISYDELTKKVGIEFLPGLAPAH